MNYSAENEAKADFSEVYNAPIPHAYISLMAKHGYEIGEQARPFCMAAAKMLSECNNDAWSVQMLDVGCSYGIGSAFVKYGCTFDEIVSFFASRAPTEYQAACQAMRMWLNVVPPACDIRCVGMDSASQAVRFGVDAGLLDGGIARDFEDSGNSPTEEERAWFRSCNLLISTGAIGYVTERTLDIVLRDLGADYPGEYGPFVVVTILRMFDISPINAVFEKHDFRFGPVPGIRLPQRTFADEAERQKVLALLRERQIDTRGWEEQGKHFAKLYVGAPPDQFGKLLDCMVCEQCERANGSATAFYIRR
jgi:carnitine O-acetyltransferase